jgi:hypothetical protein
MVAIVLNRVPGGATLLAKLLLLGTLGALAQPPPAPRLACGTAGGDPASNSRQVLALFGAAKSVCTAQLGEQGAWDQGALPLTCATPGCAQVIGTVAASCTAPFADDGFLNVAFKPALDRLVKLCSAVPTAGVVYAATDPAVQAAPVSLADVALPIFLTDGATASGRDVVTFEAPPGMEIRIIAEMLYLPDGESLDGAVNLYWNGGPAPGAPPSETWTGTTLPASEHDRTYIASYRGQMAVEYVSAAPTGDAPAPAAFFRLAVDVVCYGDDACGEHGSCVDLPEDQWAGPMQNSEGSCVCHDGWTGNACQTKPAGH